MKSIRRIYRILLIILLFFGLICFYLLNSAVFYFIDRKRGERNAFNMSRIFCRILLRCCGIRADIKNRGKLPDQNGYLVAGNHYSYFEIFAVGACTPLAPVAKMEIRSWPLFGLAAKLGGTLFVDRDSGGMSAEYIRVTRKGLRQGKNIVFYPEGTTSDGTVLYPFRSALFVAANREKRAVVPIVTAVLSVNGKPVPENNRELIAWVGGASFVPHFMKMLTYRNIRLSVLVGDPVYPDYDDTSIDERRKFAAEMRVRMDKMLREISPDYKGFADRPE